MTWPRGITTSVFKLPQPPRAARLKSLSLYCSQSFIINHCQPIDHSTGSAKRTTPTQTGRTPTPHIPFPSSPSRTHCSPTHPAEASTIATSWGRFFTHSLTAVHHSTARTTPRTRRVVGQRLACRSAGAHSADRLRASTAAVAGVSRRRSGGAPMRNPRHTLRQNTESGGGPATAAKTAMATTPLRGSKPPGGGSHETKTMSRYTLIKSRIGGPMRTRTGGGGHGKGNDGARWMMRTWSLSRKRAWERTLRLCWVSWALRCWCPSCILVC